MHYLLRLLLIVGLLVGLTLPDGSFAAAQGMSSDHKRANFWYFGQYAGLDFNTGSPVAITDGALATDEGCSVISDAEGNLLFYTDGVSVWNRLHQLMPNGTGLWGSNYSTQSALIVPKPGKSSLYYIFTTDSQADYPNYRPELHDCACLAYSVVDLSKADGLGEVVEKNTVLYAPTTEKIAATLHANGGDVWVVSHQWNSDAFYTYLVTQAGICEQPVISQAGVVHQGDQENNPNIHGQMKISPDGKRLALAMLHAGLDVFDFDNSTGTVSRAIPLLNDTILFNYQGIEFSPNSRLLYFTAATIDTIWAPYQIMQLDLTAGTAEEIKRSLVVLGRYVRSIDNIQLGPDGRIYASTYLSDSLGVVEHPNRPGPSCHYRNDGLYLQGRSPNGGLPNFISSYLLPPDPVLVMPNVFTPNGDAYNPRFAPIRQERIESATLTVCNRWGQTLCRTDDLEKGWDGNGSPTGVYYWYVRYRGSNGKRLSQKGTLTLLR
jgi:gliding motility-associated-like protein